MWFMFAAFYTEIIQKGLNHFQNSDSNYNWNEEMNKDSQKMEEKEVGV